MSVLKMTNYLKMWQKRYLNVAFVAKDALWTHCKLVHIKQETKNSPAEYFYQNFKHEYLRSRAYICLLLSSSSSSSSSSPVVIQI